MEAVGVSQDDQSQELLAKLDLLLIDYRWDENSIFHIIYLLKSQQILTIILGERTWEAASIILSRRGLIAADCFLSMRRRFLASRRGESHVPKSVWNATSISRPREAPQGASSQRCHQKS